MKTYPPGTAGGTDFMMDPPATAGGTDFMTYPPAAAGGTDFMTGTSDYAGGTDRIMWNDTDIPLAYLISFRTYGTWLHGDERGSTDRFQNVYKSSHIAASERWRGHNARQLRCPALVLNAVQRRSVEDAVRDTCKRRRWHLFALNVRPNHVHSVVGIGAIKPWRALNALKANATRQMRTDQNWKQAHSPWADKGSERYLWNERSVALAVDYVNNGQGRKLPDFD